MKTVILAAIVFWLIVAFAAYAEPSPTVGDILAGSVADTLSYATRGMSASNGLDEATSGLSPLVQEATSPLTNAVGAQIDAAHEDFQRRLEIEARQGETNQ